MKKPIGYSLFVLILLGLDQLTKLWAKTSLRGNADISIIKNVFSLHYLENRGAAFGMLQNQQLFFVIMTAIVLGGIAYLSHKLPKEARYNPLRIIALFITAGALGNLIDRLLYSYVVDFFYFELINFPVFNVADCYVTCSAIFLVLLVLFYYRDEDFAFLSRKEV